MIHHTKSIFALHGITEVVISDNGPQYKSKEYDNFAKTWGFQHKTSSPTYPQSNGLAERTVQTVKNLLKKVLSSGQDPYLSILCYRNTPFEGDGFSSAVVRRQLKFSANTATNKVQCHQHTVRFKSLTTLFTLLYTCVQYEFCLASLL